MGDWKYDGFISYSTRADGDLAPKLQDGLERLAKPWHRRRALKIFQDIDDLAATADLSSTLRSELAGSQTMVFLASPESAASPWCNDELSYWIEQRPPNELVVVLTGGTLEFDKDADHPVRFETSTAAPPAFAALTAVPLYVDLRYDDAEVARMDVRRDPEFRAKLTKISAALHSNRTGTTVEPRDIDSKDLAEHRKAMRLRTIAIVALLVLTGLATVAALYAREQRQDAVAERDRARSQALAARSLLEAERDPARSASLALEAHDAAVTPEAEQAVFAVAASRSLASVDFDADTASASSDGSRLLVSGDGGWTLLDWDGNEIVSVDLAGAGNSGTSFLSPSGGRIVTLLDDRVQLFDDEGTTLALVPGGGFETATYSPDGTQVVAAGPDGAVLWRLTDLEAGSPAGTPFASDVTAVAFGPEGFIVTAGRTGPDDPLTTVRVWSENPGTGTVDELDLSLFLSAPLVYEASVIAVAMDADNAVLVVEQDAGEFAGPPRLNRVGATLRADVDGQPFIEETAESFRSSLDAQAGSVAFSADTTQIAVGNLDGTVDVLTTAPPPGSCGDTVTFQVRLTSLGRHDGPVTGVAFSPDGSRLVTVGAGQARLWSLDGVGLAGTDDATSMRIGTLRRSDGEFSAAAITSSGETVLAAGASDFLWDLGTGTVARLGPACSGSGVGEISPDGSRAVTVGATGIHEWDISTFPVPDTGDGVEIEVVPLRSLDVGAVNDASYAGQDGSIVVATDDEVGVWDPSWSTSTVLSRDGALDVAVAGDGPDARIAVLRSDGSAVDLYDRDGQRLDTELRHPDRDIVSVAADGSGTRFVTAGVDRTARVWTSDGDEVAELVGHRLPLTSAAFQPLASPGSDVDDARIVTSSRDGTVRVWTSSGRMIAVLDDHLGRVNSAAFGPDGATIVSTGEDRTVRVWRWRDPGELLSAVRRRGSPPASGVLARPESADGDSIR